MSHPRISAVVKCHNEELFLRECIESIRPYVDEIVVIDNNSTDRSPEIAERSGTQLVRFTGEPGGTISLADYYNWCDDQTSGDYILKWDADVVALESIGSVFQQLRDKPDAVSFPLYNFRGDHLHLWSRTPLCGPEPYLYRRSCRYVSAESGIERLALSGPALKYPGPAGLHLNLKSDERYFLRVLMCHYRQQQSGMRLAAWARERYPDYDRRVLAEGRRMLDELTPYRGLYPSLLDTYLADPKWLVEYSDGVPCRRIERW